MQQVIILLRKRLSLQNLDLYSLLHRYRYLSLVVTSIFYFLGPINAQIYLKLGMVLCLFMEAYLFIRVYNESSRDRTKRALIIIELVGLLLVLLLTGGIESPFLWYAINPILLATTLMPYYFSWSAAAGFISVAVYSQRFVAQNRDFNLFTWSEHAPIILIYVLIILFIQLFYHLVSKLSQQTNTVKNQLEYIKSLYETTQVFSNHTDLQEAVNLFASYGKTLTGATKVIIWTEAEIDGEGMNHRIFSAVRGPRYAFPEENWYQYIKKLFENRANGWKIDYAAFPRREKNTNDTLVTVCIKSETKAFGVLSAYFVGSKDRDEVEKVLIFLADLCASVLDRRYLEFLNERLALASEKERIARQMHDTVTQNIFGLIHGLNTLLRTDRNLSTKTKGQLKLMSKISQQCLRDLRLSIFNLSNAKIKETSFDEEIKIYLQDFKQLNDIDINFECHGIFDNLGFAERSSFSRIIKEATSNALRHSACSFIRVLLEATEELIKVEITDNGSGFVPAEVLKPGENKGLGLISMKELARSIGGELEIQSSIDMGTKITCRVGRQLQTVALSREEGVVQ